MVALMEGGLLHQCVVSTLLRCPNFGDHLYQSQHGTTGQMNFSITLMSIKE